MRIPTLLFAPSLPALLAAGALASFGSGGAPARVSGNSQPAVVIPADSGEVHLSNLRQLTFGGENAEAYFSADGKQITFQSTGRTRV
jgi:TolB protein